MALRIFAVLVLWGLAGCVGAPNSEVLRDLWYLNRASGENLGWRHERTVRMADQGGAVYETVITACETLVVDESQRQNLRRTRVLEDREGRLIRMELKDRDFDCETSYDLEVMGKSAKLSIITMGQSHVSHLPWDKDVLGPQGVFSLMKSMRARLNEPYSFKTFEFYFPGVTTIRAVERGKEVCELLDGEKCDLWRSQVTGYLGKNIMADEWTDDEGRWIKSSAKVGEVQLELFETTKMRALGSAPSQMLPDVYLDQLTFANLILPCPDRLDSILYEFTLAPGETWRAEGFEDHRQRIVKKDGDLFQVRIHGASSDPGELAPFPDLKEYLDSNAFVQSQDPELMEAAKKAVGNEKDPWRMALKLEHFVFTHIKDRSAQYDFVSAKKAFASRRGDCTESAALLAALCRARGIPSRVASGIRLQEDYLGGHMWTEVWINGIWRSLDGSWGCGEVGPGYLRFSSSSLKGLGPANFYHTPDPMLKDKRITILSYSNGGRTVRIQKTIKDHVLKNRTFTSIPYGIGLRIPEGFDILEIGDLYYGFDSNILVVQRDSKLSLNAIFAPKSLFTWDTAKQAFQESGLTILSSEPVQVCKRPGRMYLIRAGDQEYFALYFFDRNTLFSLIQSEKKNRLELMEAAQTIFFTPVT